MENYTTFLLNNEDEFEYILSLFSVVKKPFLPPQQKAFESLKIKEKPPFLIVLPKLPNDQLTLAKAINSTGGKLISTYAEIALYFYALEWLDDTDVSVALERYL